MEMEISHTSALSKSEIRKFLRWEQKAKKKLGTAYERGAPFQPVEEILVESQVKKTPFQPQEDFNKIEKYYDIRESFQPIIKI